MAVGGAVIMTANHPRHTSNNCPPTPTRSKHHHPYTPPPYHPTKGDNAIQDVPTEMNFLLMVTLQVYWSMFMG